MEIAELLKLMKITIHVHGNVYFSPPPSTKKEPFIPNPFQRGILKALNGVALRTDPLCAACGCEHPRLFGKNGIKELQLHGLVKHHKAIGYYRPDAPPPEHRLEPKGDQEETE